MECSAWGRNAAGVVQEGRKAAARRARIIGDTSYTRATTSYGHPASIEQLLAIEGHEWLAVAKHLAAFVGTTLATKLQPDDPKCAGQCCVTNWQCRSWWCHARLRQPRSTDTWSSFSGFCA